MANTMKSVNMLQAKSSLSRLVEAIEQGQEREIVIARNGRPAAKLVPIDYGPVWKANWCGERLVRSARTMTWRAYSWAGCSPELAAGYACCPVGHHGQSEFAPEGA
ncbi:type II toxin-antitoxin system Phd/YefM family antitoxin [Acidithiobacillus sp.]